MQKPGGDVRASVIVPTYGSRTAYLRDALLSVESQNVSPDEYETLVIHNGPTDPVADIVASANRSDGPQVRYLREPNVGLHNARHVGAREARGEILVYIDDDVIAHPDWLGSLLKHFDDPQIGCVGGKIIPKWEADQPKWFSQFDLAYQSVLDLGETARELKYPECVWGANMAVRKSAIYGVGGFNPDGFGDRKLIWLRGDGECGLQDKMCQAGYKVVYEPRAWVYHRVPASRLTPEFYYWRVFGDGIMDSYIRIRKLRNRPLLALRLLGYAAFCFLQMWRRYLFSFVDTERRIRLKADTQYWYGKGQHHVRTAFSPTLRRHVFKKAYL